MQAEAIPARRRERALKVLRSFRVLPGSNAPAVPGCHAVNRIPGTTFLEKILKREKMER
jgi:hypothetical protein